MLSFTFLYASFWKRLLAFLIDVVILLLVSGFVLEPFVDFLGLRELSTQPHIPFSVMILRTYGVWALITLVVAWLYFALQESSRKQATLGKRIMGVLVFNYDEERISFKKASIRFWSKFISGSILLVGFFMALFDARHRALHDRIARTQVLQPRPEALIARAPGGMQAPA